MCVVRTRRYIPEAMERETMECGAMGEGQKKKRRKEANMKWVKSFFWHEPKNLQGLDYSVNLSTSFYSSLLLLLCNLLPPLHDIF